MKRILCRLVPIILALCWHMNGLAAQVEPGGSFHSGNMLLAGAKEVPRIQLGETTFDFGEVKEGSIVSHDFIVENVGNADLKIEQVGPTCGCLKSEFDESIPPGGKGRITLTVDFAGHQGPLERTVVVVTNDSDSPDATLSVKGSGKP